MRAIWVTWLPWILRAVQTAWAILGVIFICVILIMIFMVATSINAGAQQTICGPRDGLIEVLKSKYSEEQNGVGIVNQATVFELYVSAEGSWTMLATNTAGISCIVGSGTGWQAIPSPAPALKSDPS